MDVVGEGENQPAISPGKIFHHQFINLHTEPCSTINKTSTVWEVPPVILLNWDSWC